MINPLIIICNQFRYVFLGKWTQDPKVYDTEIFYDILLNGTYLSSKKNKRNWRKLRRDSDEICILNQKILPYHRNTNICTGCQKRRKKETNFCFQIHKKIANFFASLWATHIHKRLNCLFDAPRNNSSDGSKQTCFVCLVFGLFEIPQ